MTEQVRDGDQGPFTAAQAEGEGRGVTTLELFFDLVFVFALTQVTTMLAVETSAVNYLRGVAVLAAVWWAWSGFSWLTNARDAEGEWRRFAIVISMAAMLVVGLAIPQSFGDDALVFALAYGVVILTLILTYALSVKDDAAMLGAVTRLGIGVLPTPLLMIAAALVGPGPLRTTLIVVALAIAYVTPFIAGTRGWTVSPSHFAERYGLIIIIALGESMVAMGLGASAESLAGPTVLGVVLGVFVLAALWWLYFDVMARVAQRRLSEVAGEARNAMARDSYTYLHLPMVIGIVFLALGLKKALAHPGDHLYALVSLALFGGVALYLLAHVAFRYRNMRSWNVQRAVVAVLLLAMIPLGVVLPALASVALLALVINALVVYEVFRYRDIRTFVRGQAH